MHTSTRVLIDTSWESVTVMLTSFLLASWATDTAVSKSLPSATFSETIAAAFFYVLARARVPRQMWPQCMWCVVCVCVRERERVSTFFYVLARACVHRQINVTCDPSACGALCMCVWESFGLPMECKLNVLATISKIVNPPLPSSPPALR